MPYICYHAHNISKDHWGHQTRDWFKKTRVSREVYRWLGSKLIFRNFDTLSQTGHQKSLPRPRLNMQNLHPVPD